uniref:Uncharacterized protein n=1 Tax=Knipowitschia caucasica TaxID=637954 RepID=A0AAV2LI94_KNICA
MQGVATESSTKTAENSMDFSNVPPLPGQDSPLRWGGNKFEDLPIVYVKATYNNTYIQLTDGAGASLVRTSSWCLE